MNKNQWLWVYAINSLVLGKSILAIIQYLLNYIIIIKETTTAQHNIYMSVFCKYLYK